MASHQRCCCGVGDDCCTECAENCKVAELAKGMGSVRTRIFVDLDVSFTDVSTRDCGSKTESFAYTVSHTADTTELAPASGAACRYFEVEDEVDDIAVAWTRVGTGCLEEDADFSRDYGMNVAGGVRTNGDVYLELLTFDLGLGPMAGHTGGVSLRLWWRRNPGGGGCAAFIVEDCYGEAFFPFNLPPLENPMLFSNPDNGGMTITGLDSACHGDITVTLAKTASNSYLSGDTTHDVSAEVSGTVRLLVEGLEPCDAGEPMPDLPGSCNFPAPDPEPTECCDVAGDPCKPIDDEAPFDITIDRVFARVRWQREGGITCDTGDPLNPDQAETSAGWVGLLNLTGVTLAQDSVVSGCPVYKGHYEVTADRTGTVPNGCAGGVAFVAPASGSMTMTVDFTYRPGLRRCSMAIEVKDTGAAALSTPKLRIFVDLDPANSPVTDDSVAYARNGGATIGVTEFDIPADWDIDSYESVCHSGFAFSGNGGPPIWEDPRQKGDNTVTNEETWIWEGELDLSGLEACA